jgi:hypothetical protein
VLVTRGGTKIVSLAGGKLVGAAKAIAHSWAKRLKETHQAGRLIERLQESPEQDRSAILESGFEAWIREQSSDAAEIARFLYRIVYLRALVSYCRMLPMVGGASGSLILDELWVPQTFRIRSASAKDKKKDGAANDLQLTKSYFGVRNPIGACWRGGIRKIDPT